MLIRFLEGTRDEPERLAGFRKGVARIAKRHDPGLSARSG